MAFIQPAIPVAAANEPPPGFYPLSEGPGVALYRKDYANGTPDFVLTVDLSAGAAVDLLHGEPTDNSGKRPSGMYAGTNPAFTQTTITRYWNQYAEAQPQAFCVINGQFFFMVENPTPLALPLKVDGVLLSEGFGYPQYPEKQLMLALWPDRVDILPLTQENLYGTDAPNVLGGLTEEANKKPKNVVGRTFVGISDINGDGVFETISLLATQTATQAAAAKVLRGFGADKIMMLDGGGSSQLVCQGQTYIDTTRAIPQALGIAAAPAGVHAVQGADPAPVAAPAAASMDLLSAQPPVTEPPAAPILEPTPLPVQSQTGGQAAVESALQAAPLVVEPTLPPVEFTTPNEPTPTGEPEPFPAETSGSITAPILGDAEREGRLGLASDPTQPSGQPGAPDQLNMGDALWLPAIISPISALILLLTRRRNRAPYPTIIISEIDEADYLE